MHIEEQSPDIGQGVHGMGTKTLEEIGAGDQVGAVLKAWRSGCKHACPRVSAMQQRRRRWPLQCALPAPGICTAWWQGRRTGAPPQDAFPLHLSWNFRAYYCPPTWNTLSGPHVWLRHR